MLYMLAGLLVVISTLTYSNHFHNSFHFDDSHAVVNNIYIKSLRNIPLFFKDASTFSSLPVNQTYRPIVVTSLAVDYYLGKGLNPVSFHISMFVLFLVQGLFMYLLYIKVSDLSEKHASNSMVALCAVAWYLLHPANAETINYISARSDTLSTLFGLISMVLYIYSPFCRKRLIYLFPLAVAVLAKPIAVFFVPLLMVYVYLFDDVPAGPAGGKKKKVSGSRLSWTIKKSWPLLLFALLMMLFTKAMTPATFTPGGAPFFNYLITQPYVILHYFTTFFLPTGLSADTDWIPFATAADPRFFGGVLFIAALVYAAVFLSKNRKTRPMAFGLIWFFVALLPTSLFPLAEVTNDHRIFFPYIGLTISICWALTLCIRQLRESVRIPGVIFTGLVSTFVIAGLSAYAYGTYQRNNVWKTEETLWLDVTVKSPKNGRGLMNYGLTLMGKGDYAGADRYFNRALEFTPKYAYLHINLGILNAAAGRTKEAEEHFRNALDFNPNFPGSYSYYAKFLVGQKRFDEAIDLAEKALKLSSADLDVRHLLLDMYLEKLDAEKLTAFASETLQIAPDDQKALLYLNAARKGRQGLQFLWEKTKAPTPKTAVDFLNLSLHYYNAKEYEKSIEAAKEALKRKPDFDLAYNNLCVSYNRLNKWDLAIEAGEKAVKLNPNNQLARNNLAWARNGKAGKTGFYMESKKNLQAAKTPEDLLNLSLLYYNAKEYEKSLEAAKAALKLRPGYSEAYNNICAANNSLRRWGPAIEACEKALKINPDNQLARNNLAWAKKQSSTRN